MIKDEDAIRHFDQAQRRLEETLNDGELVLVEYEPEDQQKPTRVIGWTAGYETKNLKLSCYDPTRDSVPRARRLLVPLDEISYWSWFPPEAYRSKTAGSKNSLRRMATRGSLVIAGWDVNWPEPGEDEDVLSAGWVKGVKDVGDRDWQVSLIPYDPIGDVCEVKGAFITKIFDESVVRVVLVPPHLYRL